MVSVFATDGTHLTVVVAIPERESLNIGIKLRICGEYHLLLTVDGELFLADYCIREKTVKLILLREDVADFDTEGNWMYVVSKSEGKLYQGKNGCIGQWKLLFEDHEDIRFEKVCCNNNGILLTSSEGSKLYACGDFGNLLNFDQLSPITELGAENIIQISAGIDFVILSSQNIGKVLTDVRKDPYYDRFCFMDDADYLDWKNIYKRLLDGYKSCSTGLENNTELNSVSSKINVDTVKVFGQLTHETGVASFGKINKGQLGTGDHIRRDKIMHLKLFNVSKIATCCDYSSALTVEGSLYLWGDTNKNQATLDNNITLTSTSTPKLFDRFRNILDVGCGNFQTYVLTNDLKIYDILSDDGCVNYECMDRKRFSELTKDVASIDEIPLILASDSIVLVNNLPIDKEALRVYTKQQTTVQALLKHFRENNVSKILKQPMNNLSPHFFYRSCTNLFYLLLLNLKSMRCFLLENDFTKIISFLMHRELLFLHKQILECYCDGNCLGLMHEPEESLLNIFLNSVKHYVELIELLVSSNKSLDEEAENRLLTAKSEWLNFSNEEVSEQMGKLTKATKEFWLKEENSRWLSLRQANRRVILDSADVPLKLLEVNIFSSSPRIVLFSDVLCYLSGTQLVSYPLELIWITTEVKEPLSNRHKEKLRFLVSIVTPEEVLRCHTLNSVDKLVWMNCLKTQVMRCLKKDATMKQPVYRYKYYEFSEKHTKYGGMEYFGIWKVGHIDGIGVLKGAERVYKGELYHGDITGYGSMSRTHYGIMSEYEGDLLDGKYNGYGKLKSANSSSPHYFRYQGYFKSNKYHGFGTHVTSAYQYNGDFMDDSKEGFGVLEDSLDGVKYIGMFANDKKYGNGILITTNGTYFAGLFTNDLLSNSAGGLAIFPNGVYYKGELTIEGPCGKGVFHYPEREVKSESFELDDTNTQMSGHTLTGTFAGTWENVKISNASMTMSQQFNKVPILDLKINAERKWASIFSCFHQSVFGTSDVGRIRLMEVKSIWNKVAIYINRAKRKQQLKANNFEAKFTEFSEQSAAEICHVGFRMSNLSTTSLRSSFSDSKLSLNLNGSAMQPEGALAASDNISVRSFSSVTSREYDDEFMLNPSGGQSRTSSYRDLDIIPDFCINTIDKHGLQLLRDYLSEAFSNTFHPLHELFEKLSNCFYSTYSCWKFTPNSILCEPAMNEWMSIVSRIYTLVLRVMFPALPKDSAIVDGELISYQTVLYPILMTQGIYSALFVLYASKCSKNDEIYRQRILICEKKTDENLIQLLDINRELIPIIQNDRYLEAIESLNRFKEKCCPSEMMFHINEAFNLVDMASKEQDTPLDLAADSLLELVILLIIKANLPQLGAELSLLEDLLQNDGLHRNTENDYCLTTLKASYQHIIGDNFFVNKLFEGASA
ncbi:alsin homolog [Sabethes cyaneus]|uniref:alsin homolog n=1 Tax=Sabethes cyaneus TaxID=53552 RepID=UPI00237E0E61|nr:alsin homolog [Sabethes cyaneus]